MRCATLYVAEPFVMTLKYSIDPKHTESWLAPIGKLVVNFGALELETFQWIDTLSNRTRTDRAINQMFKPRVLTILGLSANVPDKKLRKEIEKVWQEALRIAEFRNVILHNPIVFGHSSANEDGPPDIIVIPNIKAVRKSKPPRMIATLREINDHIDRLVHCVRRSNELLRQIVLQ